jgi:hypothetical protein
MTLKNNSVPFQAVIDELMENGKPFPGSFLNRFSDMPSDDLALLKTIWPEVKPKRRLSLVEDLVKFNENNTIVCFDDVAALFLKDDDLRVRVAGIRLLRESEDSRVVEPLISLLEHDKQFLVRAAAAVGLGQFVLLGELDKISPEKLARIERVLLPRITGTDDDLVRRSALEAMGFSSRKEMDRLIADAFEETDPDWIASALVAMGRSASEDWEMHILRSLFHPDMVVRIEAVRAAGALSLSRAVEPMLEMLDGTEPNKEVRFAAIWSLSEIGGEKANAALEAMLDNAVSDEETEFIEQAIENSGSENGALGLDFLDLNDLTNTSSGRFADLDDEEDEDDYGAEAFKGEYDDEEADFDEDFNSSRK